MSHAATSLVMALAVAGIGVIALAATPTAGEPGPRQSEPTPAATCDPALVEPVVTVEFQLSTVRPSEPVTADIGFRNFNPYTLAVWLHGSRGESVPVREWTGRYELLHPSALVIRFAAPLTEGDWTPHVEARGEGVLCENGTMWPSYTTVSSRLAVTLTVRGAVLSVPVALRRDQGVPGR